MNKTMTGFRAKSIEAIITYLLQRGIQCVRPPRRVYEDCITECTFYVGDNNVLVSMPNFLFGTQYPQATIIVISDDRCLPISLEEARKWYFSSNTDLQALALRVYCVEELLPTYNEIFVMEECKALTEKEKAHRALSMVAKYLNQGWTKTLGSTGFFVAMGVHGDRVLELPTIGIAKHESVIYPGVVYFRKKSDIHLAARILGKEIIEGLFA